VLALESNNLPIVIGFGFGFPKIIQILANIIGTRSLCALCLPSAVLLWPVSVDIIEYILYYVMQSTRLLNVLCIPFKFLYLFDSPKYTLGPTHQLLSLILNSSIFVVLSMSLMTSSS
jgi:hypothetical protein